MASWKKIIVSGSAAELSAITASNLTNDNILVAGTGGTLESSGITYNGTTLDAVSANIKSTGGSSQLSGSFSGSFIGDGSGLTGIASTLSIIDQSSNTDLINLQADQLTFSGSNGFDFTVSDNKITLNSPQLLGTSDSPQFASVTAGNLQVSNTGLYHGENISIDAANLILGSTAISGSIVPSQNATFDLGSNSNRFVNIYARFGIGFTSIQTTEITGSSLVLNGENTTTLSAKTGNVNVTATAGSVVITGGQGNVSVENVTFDGDDVVIPGNLTVQGTQTNVNTANLDIEDAFVLLRSGSSTVGDSGLIFGGSTGFAQAGTALFWDASYNLNDGRLAIKDSAASTITGSLAADYYVAGVVVGSEAQAETAQADHPGNIRVDVATGEIFIYV
jgi:hypothetical protein